ncbi:MAG TPA: N-acetylmuramoyl-L-alanine amidase [Candidatus Paceibacterota bacterium]
MTNFSRWPSPTRFKIAIDPLRRAGIPITYVPGWNDPSIAADQAKVPTPHYAVLHHTGRGVPFTDDHNSLNWLANQNGVKNDYAPIRGIHVLIGRAGGVFVVYFGPCYHAGAGGLADGSWHRGDGPSIPQDLLNPYSFGVEMESEGTSAVPNSTGQGYTAAQLHSAFLVEAAFLKMISELAGRRVSDERLVEHEDWSPRKSGDTLLTHAQVQSKIHAARVEYESLINPPPPPAPSTSKGFNKMLIRRSVNGWVYFFDGTNLRPVGPASYPQYLKATPQVILDEAAFNRMKAVYPLINSPVL